MPGARNPNPGPSEIGSRARMIRRRRGLSLDAAAGLAGISKPYLSMLERGLRGFALTALLLDRITDRVVTLFNWLGLSSISPDTYPIDAEHTYTESMATGMWCAVILHLIIVEWILLRPKRKANADLRVSV